MAGFVEGADRAQSTLLPECLDDWVDESNPVRFIDAFVGGLDLKALGFAGVDPADTGRPAYHASVHLKLYVYGYLNRVHSSRRLEREAGRNLEVMWLLQRLAPDFKTIADFRKDNGPAIKKVCARFIEVCRKLDLLKTASVAIDGSKFKAVNNRDKNFTKAKVERRRKQLEESVSRYLSQLDTADLQEQTEAITLKRIRLKDKLEKLHSEMAKLDAMEKQMLASPDEQISLTDPDSRSMATSGRGSGVVGYNVQVATETEHHLIIAHEVTNVGSDRSQLAKVAKAAKEVLQVDKLEAVADRGYYHGEEIKACADASITVTLPKPLTSGAKSEGRFGKQDFAYLADEDVYRCPAGEKLRYYYTNEENGQKLRNYWTNACRHCALKPRCTSATPRRIKRWEHEHVLEAVQERLDRNPDAMRTRREVVEHPFGTIKMRMGATHFLMKTLPKVATEMALAVLGYNLTRVINIVGVARMMEAVRA
ncbi:MAG: IS1182 family transposase [Methyloceanibacter sp.]